MAEATPVSHPASANQAGAPQSAPDITPINGAVKAKSSPTSSIEVICGPLLNYKGLGDPDSGEPIWQGSALLVTKPGSPQPCLELVSGERAANASSTQRVDGLRLYEDPDKVFWQFSLSVPLAATEAQWTYSFPNAAYPPSAEGSTPRPKSDDTPSYPSTSFSFAVPPARASMRIMFHSCNGFSVGTDVDDWSGPALWNDVLRMHVEKPFHVMVGGGDQIYNDGVRVEGPLAKWTAIANPHKRREYGFDEELRKECDEFYFQNYVRWYTSSPFREANARIPQINVWDDHDIIDGFGSYTDRFMRCNVFRGIGGVSFKYYCLFQHHAPPAKSTFTTDAPQTTHGPGQGDPVQLKNTFVLDPPPADPSFIMGSKPGPYVEEHSRSIYCRLGARIAFVGLDARTERTRHQVNYPDTYNLIFARLERELAAAANKVKHLVVLLGVPIAYPRLVWLENLFTSPIIAPIRLLNRRFGLAGGLFNKFDGQVDLLDDLDDHYTARLHKRERRELIQRLQALAQRYSVRVTILGGDVHLAALGRFYSAPKLAIPVERDHRYMPNVISSAITNKPPPPAVANLLARRNKIHHLDRETDETLVPLFDRDPGVTRAAANGTATANGVANGGAATPKGKKRTADSNHVTMPSRNYAVLTVSEEEASMDGAPAKTNTAATTNGTIGAGVTNAAPAAGTSGLPGTKKNDGHKQWGPGERGAGSMHAVASGLRSGALPGGLDVAFRIEIDQHDPDGRTDGYGFSIPPLEVAKA